MSRRKHRFYTPKNWERHKYQQKSFDIKISRQIADKVIFIAQVREFKFDEWTLLYASSTKGIKLSKHDITVNVIDSRSEVHVGGKVVSSFKQAVHGMPELLSLLENLNHFGVCPAIKDQKYFPLIEKHSGIFHDSYGKTIIHWYMYSSNNIIYTIIIGNVVAHAVSDTIRHVKCAMLVKPDTICEQCKLYRSNSLLRLLHRLVKENKENEQCSSSSHANYRFLTPTQKDERLKSLHDELRKRTRQLHSVEKAIEKFCEKESVTLDGDDNFDMRTLMKQYSSTVAAKHKAKSFQSLFWKQQLEAATKSNARSIRWHPLIIKWCLYLHHRSSGAYKTLRESGVLSLPSGRTLRDYRHFAPSKSGFGISYDQQLLELTKNTKSSDLAKHIVVLIDEMYVKEGLVYNKTSGALTGFVELGDIDSHLDEFERCCSPQNSKRQKALAKTIVVFMVRGAVTSLIFP